MAGYYSKLLESRLSDDGVIRRVHRIMLIDLPDFDPTDFAPDIIDEFRERITDQFIKFSQYNISIDVLSIRGSAKRRMSSVVRLLDFTKPSILIR